MTTWSFGTSSKVPPSSIEISAALLMVPRASRTPIRPVPEKRLCSAGIGQRVDEHRNAERSRGGERRARFLVAEQQVAPGAFDEHAAKLELLDGARQFARGGVAAEGIDGGEPVELAGMLSRQFRHLVVDALDRAGRDIAVGVLDERGRSVDHARGDAGGFDRRQQRVLDSGDFGSTPPRPAGPRAEPWRGWSGSRTGPCSDCGSRRFSTEPHLAPSPRAAVSEPAAATPAPSAPRNSRREVSLSAVIASLPETLPGFGRAFGASLRLTVHLHIASRRVLDGFELAAAGLARPGPASIAVRLDPLDPVRPP